MCIKSDANNGEANPDGADADSPDPLFFSFSASFRNPSPREKVGNCLRFGTGGWSLCFFPLLSRNTWVFFPTLTMAACAKKISGEAICLRHQRESAPSRFGARVRYWIWLRGSASYVITIFFCHGGKECVHNASYLRSPSYFSALLQTRILLQGTCRGFSPTFWTREAIELRNELLSIARKSFRAPLFHTSLSKK